MLEKRTTLFWLLRPVLSFWTMNTLDPCSDGDINNDVSSLYVEIIDKNRSYYKWPKVVEETKTRNSLELCSWQRWEITQANHNFLGVSNKVNRRSHLKGVFSSKRTLTTSVLSVCQMFAKCADDPQVLELLQKCFVRIKKQNKFTAVSHENRAKKLKKKKQQQQS